LSPEERTLVERHPVYTWEILGRVRAFAHFAWTAATHHEKLDGSGYPWQLTGDALDLPARVTHPTAVRRRAPPDRGGVRSGRGECGIPATPER